MSKRNATKRPSRLFRFLGSEGPAPAPPTDCSVSTSNRSSGTRGGDQAEKAVVAPHDTLADAVTSNHLAGLPPGPEAKLEALAREGLGRQQLNFWEIAYQDIIDDEDDETQAIVESYDVLLDRMIQQGGGEPEDNGILQEAEIPAGKEDARGLSGSESLGGDDIVKRRVGCEEEMRSMAVAKLAEMQRKEWVMKWNGHVFTVREQVTRIVKIMQHISGLVGQAASSNPSAGLAWAGVCVILPLIINDTEEREAAINGVEYVARVVARFRTVEDDYVSGRFGKNGDFEKSLVSLYRSLAYFYMKSACYFARSTPFRTIRGLVAADAWISTLDSVKKTETECVRLAAMLGCSSSLKKIDNVLEDLARMEFKDLIKDIEDWLIPDVNVAQQHQAKQPNLASGYEKAGSWLLESPEFRSWEEEAGGQFWIKGAIGTGKSSLVAIIVDHMRRRLQGDFAFFYCTVDQIGATQAPKSMEDDVTATRVLRGLLGQLAMSPDGRRIVEEIEVAFNRSFQPGSLGRVPLSLKDAKDLLVRVINSRRCTTIIVDGLDEVPNYRHLLRTLRDIYEQVDGEKLRLLLASQSVVPVASYFPSVELAIAGGPSSIADMESFINGRVQQFNETSPVTLSPGVSEDIVNTLSTKAEGMFKWAELCLARVLDDEKLSTEIEEYWLFIRQQQFRGLLVDLVVSYEYLYNKSLPKGDPKERGVVQRASQRALLWALGTGRLSQEEYLELQTGETNEASAGHTFKVCQNFLHESNGTITALHSSVWDFVSLKVTGRVEEFIKAADSESQLEKSEESILKEAKKAAKSKAKLQVATDCLRIVTSSKGMSSGEGSEDERPWESSSPLMTYACLNWIRYSNAVSRSGEDSAELLEMRKTLFEPENVDVLQRWVRIYNWIQGLCGPTSDPLYYAVLTGYDDVVQCVLDKTERSSWVGGRFGKPVQFACFRGEASMVHKMLRKINVDEADDVFGTPLHAALAGRQGEVYDILVNEYNANVNAPSVAFGNAVQIALALDEQDILESLIKHGAIYDPGDCRGRIFAEAWRLVRDLDLELLRICVACQREAAESTGPRRGFLSSLAAQQIRRASITTSGYVPMVLTWAHLSYITDPLNRQNMVLKHDRFIQIFGDTIQDPDLEKVLAELFAHIFMESAHQSARKYLHSKNLPKLNPFVREAEAIKKFDREAEELERHFKETLAISQHSAVMSAMDKMANDISDMGQQITQLTNTVQLLLDLQQKPDTGEKARSPSSASAKPIDE